MIKETNHKLTKKNEIDNTCTCTFNMNIFMSEVNKFRRKVLIRLHGYASAEKCKYILFP